MTVNEIKNIVTSVVSSERTGYTLKPEDFNLYLQKANFELFNQSLKNWENKQVITDILYPFKVKADLTFAAGVATRPADYARHSAAWYDDGATIVPVEVVTDAELPDRINNAITAPTVAYPIIYFLNEKINILPVSITTGVDLLYVKKPTTPVYAEKVENEINVYDSASSTQLDFDEIYHPDVIRTIIGFTGIDVKDSLIIQAIEREKQENIK